MSDTTLHIPQAVRDAAARADALLQEIGATGAGGEPTSPAVPPAPPPPPPTTEAPATPAAPAPPGPSNPPIGEGHQAAPTDPAPSLAEWEHRYRSEKGRRERAEQQMRDLTQEVDNLRRVLAAREAATPGVPPAPQVTRLLSDEDQLTDDERRDYGEDMLRVFGKQAKQVAAQIAAPLLAEIDGLKQQLAGVGGYVQQDAKQRFLADLERLTQGKWQGLNKDEDFLDWLDARDPYAGVPRRALLNDAQAAGDAARAAAFFNGFLAQREATAPPSAAPDPASPADPAGTRQVTLADLAAPGRAKGAGQGAPAEKPIWSQRDITRFYDDVRRGVFQGREAEKQRLESDIIAAAGEGRIRN